MGKRTAVTSSVEDKGNYWKLVGTEWRDVGSGLLEQPDFSTIDK